MIYFAAGDNGVGAVDSRLGQTGLAVSPCNTESVSSVHIKVSISGQYDKGEGTISQSPTFILKIN